VAVLIHEVWEAVSDGMTLYACSLAGPDGNGCRGFMEPGARLLTTYEAGSHFEAMTVYNRYPGRETYTTNEVRDYRPYPDEWLAVQQRHAETDAAEDGGA
jgi:hypothetical protein